MDTGWLNPTAAANVDLGNTASWNDPSNIYSSNNVYSRASPVFSIPDRLGVKTFNASLPTGAQIVGFEVGVEGYLSVGGPETLKVKLYKNPYTVTPAAADVSDEKTNSITGTETVLTFGSSTDTWGETFTVTDVNSSDFGVGVELSSYTGDCYIDHVKLKVYYVLGGSRVQFIGI